MGLEKIKSTVEDILKRTSVVLGKGEEATKQALVLPLIESLGYDIWNPEEVCPEFEADPTIKKKGQKEKVDYAILINGQTRILIEVKAIGENLDGHQGQLKKYFNSHPSVSLGILTNGTEYRYFTDTGDQNIQDDDPFFVSNFESVEQGLDVLSRFQKEIFSPEAIREYATELTYKANIIDFLSMQIDVRENELSESFIRWILKEGNIYQGKVNSKVVDTFEPIVKDALQHVIKKIVRRSVAAMDLGVSSSEKNAQDEEFVEMTFENVEPHDPNDSQPQEDRMEELLSYFAKIKKLFESSKFVEETIYNPSTRQREKLELAYRETRTYFNIYFNKPSWWNLRIYLSPKTSWLGIDIQKETADMLIPEYFEKLKPTALAEVRVKITDHKELNDLEKVILASFEKTIKDREKYVGEEESA
jgi:predicted type IV restriction endonuclease